MNYSIESLIAESTGLGKKSTVGYSNEQSDGYTDGITQDITSSLESLETVILYDRIKRSNNEQKIRMIKRLNSVYTKSISNKQIVNSIETWNNRQIEEMGIVDHYAISTEGLKDIFDKIIEVISKIIRAITDVIRKILGKKTKKEIIKRLKEACNKMHEDQRAEFVRDIQQRLTIFSDWFPNVDKPVFPDLSLYDVSQLKTLMSEINKINSQFIKLSEGIGAPRATHERLTDAKNMAQLLEHFKEKFLNNPDIRLDTPVNTEDNINNRRRYMISMLKLKPKLYTPNSKDPVSTFSILTDFVEKNEKFTNDVNSAFLNPLQRALVTMEHSLKKMKSHLYDNVRGTEFEALRRLSFSYSEFIYLIERVYIFTLTFMCREMSLAIHRITYMKGHHDNNTQRVGGAYEEDIKKYEKKLF